MGGLSDCVLDYLMGVEEVKRNTEAFVSSDTLGVVVVLVSCDWESPQRQMLSRHVCLYSN